MTSERITDKNIFVGNLGQIPFIVDRGNIKLIKPESPTPTKPMIPDRTPEHQKKHIKKNGKR